MITFEDARRTTLENAVELPTEEVPLLEAGGRYLASDVRADRDLPARDLSAMDGYACRAQDLPGPLRVIETIAAGHDPVETVGQGQCAKIMTGAGVPQGADTVVMVERTTESDGQIMVTDGASKSNIRYRGEEVVRGATLLTRGERLTPPRIAVCASVGVEPVPVFRRPRVGVIATGEELVPPSVVPTRFQIRESNGHQLCAQIIRAGAIPRYAGTVLDTPEDTERVVAQTLECSDVVVLSGGVSMGDFDYVPAVLKKLGVELLFEKVSVQPGRPTIFGVMGNKRFFGLPGNPVSTYVQFELLVRPFLAAMAGNRDTVRIVKADLASEMKRRKPRRVSFHPVRLLRDGTAEPLPYRGSGHIHAYTHADGVVAFAEGETVLPRGRTVDVHLLEP